MGIRSHRNGRRQQQEHVVEEPLLAGRRDLQRAERIREVIAGLSDLSAHVPVIVEGRRDREALRVLGVEGEIIAYNKGLGVDEFCDEVAAHNDKVVLLTDWDREGDALLEKIGRGLPGHWEEFGLFRETLKALSQKDIKDVEGLPALLRRLEAGMIEETLIPKEDAMRELGEAGEELAAKYLKEQGCRIIRRNYRCPLGEIDIIAEDGETVVFVEVKARAKGAMVSPVESVDTRKQEKLSTVAMHYLGTLGRKGGPPPARFDIIGVSIREGEPEDIEHLKDAFSLGSGDALWA